MSPAHKTFQHDIPRLEKIHAVTARLFKRQVPHLDIADAVQGKQMPVFAVAIAAGGQIVAAVHDEPCPALAADNDIARILHAEEAVRLPGHRSRLCAHDHAVREHDLHVRGHADRFHQPLRGLPVNDDFRRARVECRLQAFGCILRVPSERRRHRRFAWHVAA